MRLSHLTIEQAADAICWIDSAGRIYRVNKSACNLLEYSEEELSSMKVSEICRKYQTKEWAAYWDELKDQGILQFETFYTNKDGMEIPVEIRANHIEFEGEEYVCHFARDITRRRQIEESLRKSQANLAEAQRLAHIGSWELDLVTNKLFWSDEIYNIFGLTPQEFGATYEAFLSSVHAADREFVEQAVDDALYRNKPYNIEHRIVLPHGKIRTVNERGEVGYNDFGEPIRMIGTVQDITERKKYEEELRASKTRLAMAQEIAHIGSWDWDLVTQKIIWSDEVFRIFGYEPGEVAPGVDTVVDRIHPDDKELFHQVINKAMQGQKSGGTEFRLILPGGEIRTLYRLFELIYDKDKKPVRMVGTVQDITDWKNAENKISRLNRLYSVLSEVNESIVRVHDAESLYESVCQTAVKKGGFRMAWVGIVDEKSGRVEAVSSAGVVDGYLDNININIRDTATGKGPTGACIVQDCYNICTDFENDPRMSPWRQKALERGYRSSAAFPIRIDRKVIGAFTIYSSEPGFFTDEEIKLLSSLAEDISFALESIRKEKMLKAAEGALRRSEANLAEAQRLAHAGSWEWDLITDEIFWSEELYRIFGLDPHGPPPGLEAPLQAVHPDDREAHRKRIKEARAGKGSYHSEHRIILPDGRVRTIYSVGEVVFDESHKPIRMFGSAQDITERKQAEDALRIALNEVETLRAKLQVENIYLQEEIKLSHNFDEIISSNETLKKALRRVEQVAATNTTVLILGETGTGKELFARAIHNISNRRHSPLVKVNCAALPANLIESELFGHEKGAFTGALSRKEGRFKVADKGTIFLDEIGDLPLDLQAKFLRVLENGEFERLGDPTPIKVDVRVIAATNSDIKEAAKSGNFRGDLYYRLNVFPINIIPLRERIEDIPILISYFVKKYSAKIGKKIDVIPKKAIDDLKAYPWPGNVRELENVIERAVILSDGPELYAGDLPSAQELAETPWPTNDGKLQEMEKALILKTLDDCNWVISGKRGAAIRLGLAPSSLRDKMKKHGLKKPE